MKSDPGIEGCGSELTTRESQEGVLVHVCPVCDGPDDMGMVAQMKP
jgi:hypothetical protein